MKKLSMVKGSLELLTSIGVGLLGAGFVTMVKPTNLNVLKRIAIGVGGFALSNMAADKVVDYVDEKWDATAEAMSKLFHKKTTEETTEKGEGA